MNEIIVVSKDEFISLFDRLFDRIDQLENQIHNINQMEIHFSRRQAANYLNISQRTLDSCTKNGEIKYSKIKSKVVFRKSELDRYLTNKETRIRKFL